MTWDGVLVRFGEIGIKSPPVRKRFLDRLAQNLRDQMTRRGVDGSVARQGARLWLHGADADALLDVAQHTFGVVSASPAMQVEPTMQAMSAAAVDLALAREWATFAVRANRDGDQAFTSQDVGREVGSAIYVASEQAGRTPAVDLSTPDLAIHVDVRPEHAFVFVDSMPGPGGLPMGAQGKVLALVSDPASMVAAWLMMRRGCKVVPVHAGTSGSLPVENLEVLQDWGLGEEADLLPICTGFVSKPVFLEAAIALADRIGAQAVVTGDTLDSDLTTPAGDVPVLRPVCGLAPTLMQAKVDLIGLDDDEPEHIFDAGSHETVETALSMHRVVEIG